MWGVSLTLFSLVYSIHAHKTQIDAAPGEKSLASVLFASNPAFASRQPASSTSHRAVNRFAEREPRMQEAAPVVEGEAAPPKFDVKEMAGVSAPLGFFDPLGYTEGTPEGKVRFYREVELKHCRISMLAALGYLVAEQFHPLFGGDIDIPSLKAFQQTPLQNFFFQCVLGIGIIETFSIFTFENPSATGKWWQIKSDHEPGNLGFDPLGLKPTNPKDLKEMQTKELNNGRLAMFAIAGMIYQEVATGNKLL
jgi:hypothetical protein